VFARLARGGGWCRRCSVCALITGSTGGIGAETARLMASAGAEVIVSGRNAERWL